MPQILPLFPDNIDTFYDVFAGGGNVGINIKANSIICNDIVKEIIKLFVYWQFNELETLINNIEGIIIKYGLSQSSNYGYEYYNCNSNDGLSSYNREAWRKLRCDYNKSKDIELLYPLIIFTFNNHIKFDENGNFTAGGCNKRDFNNSLKKRFEGFINKIHKTNIKFINKDFRYFKATPFKENDFIYCDPPYLITEATYNKWWTKKDELDLLEFLDNLHIRGVKFALSNVLESKGKNNDILKDWAEKYNIHYLDKNYSNSNYQRKNGNKKDVEVLITNY